MIDRYGFIDIVIRRDSLEKIEVGLSQKIISEYEVTEPHYDEYLICIPGGMNPMDVEARVIELETKYGLVFNPYMGEGPTTDIVIIDGWHGMLTRNRWLEEVKEKRDDGKPWYRYRFRE